MWNHVVPSTSSEASVPSNRCKHAACLNPTTQQVYILGGKNGNISLKDFWLYSLETGAWTCLSRSNRTPINVQEHSMVYWKDNLYVFGGMFSPPNECPLWIYQIQSKVWSQWKRPKNQSFPEGRKAHTCTVLKNAMYIYGGYQDMRGSLSQLWQFSFENNSWKMIHDNEAKSPSFLIPPSRHRHSCVLFDEGLWVYGGMTDLQERSDLWRLDLISKRWSLIRTKFGPGSLHSHSAQRLLSFMIIFGGERQGNLSNECWRFHFGTEIWERIEVRDPKPSARTQLASITFGVAVNNDDCRPVHFESTTVENTTVSTANTANNGNKSRLLFTRNRGYHLVNGSCNDCEDDDLENMTNVNARETARTTVVAWKPKISAYSLLSSASGDSFVEEISQDISSSEITDGDMCAADRFPKLKSESVHNFHLPSDRWAVPRSLTTGRINPFIAESETKIGQANTHLNTSDYISEIRDSTVSVVGIQNPLYEDFIDDICEDDDHKNYVLALNNSQRTGHTGRVHSETWWRAFRLASERNRVDCLMQLKNNSPAPDNSIAAKQWSMLTFGGREEGHVTAFDRSLSVWMLRI